MCPSWGERATRPILATGWWGLRTARVKSESDCQYYGFGVCGKNFYTLKVLSGTMDSKFPKAVKMFISIALLLAGFIMYWVWGLMYGSWNPFEKDYIGVYSMVVVMVALGLIGLLLTLKEHPS